MLGFRSADSVILTMQMTIAGGGKQRQGSLCHLAHRLPTWLTTSPLVLLPHTARVSHPFLSTLHIKIPQLYRHHHVTLCKRRRLQPVVLPLFRFFLLQVLLKIFLRTPRHSLFTPSLLLRLLKLFLLWLRHLPPLLCHQTTQTYRHCCPHPRPRHRCQVMRYR